VGKPILAAIRKFKTHQLALQTVDYKKRICAFCETLIYENKSICYKCLKNYDIQYLILKIRMAVVVIDNEQGV
jgi:hypothetical protein